MSKRANARPVKVARWSLTVLRETDQALRTLLASRGAQKGGLSRFVEDAVNREILRETMQDIHARNADHDPSAIEQLIDDELRAAKQSIWAATVSQAFYT